MRLSGQCQIMMCGHDQVIRNFWDAPVRPWTASERVEEFLHHVLLREAYLTEMAVVQRKIAEENDSADAAWDGVRVMSEIRDVVTIRAHEVVEFTDETMLAFNAVLFGACTDAEKEAWVARHALGHLVGPKRDRLAKDVRRTRVSLACMAYSSEVRRLCDGTAREPVAGFQRSEDLQTYCSFVAEQAVITMAAYEASDTRMSLGPLLSCTRGQERFPVNEVLGVREILDVVTRFLWQPRKYIDLRALPPVMEILVGAESEVAEAFAAKAIKRGTHRAMRHMKVRSYEESRDSLQWASFALRRCNRLGVQLPDDLARWFFLADTWNREFNTPEDT